MIRNVQGQTHIKDNFNFVNDRQSDIVDYRAAYFAAKNALYFPLHWEGGWGSDAM